MRRNLKIYVLIFLFLMNLISSKEVLELLKEGNIYLKCGEYDKSIKIFEDALKITTENPDIYYYLGEAYYRKGELNKAVTNLKKAIEINPKNVAYYYTLSHVYLLQKKEKEALENLDQIIKISPLSIYGREASQLKKTLIENKKESELVKKWEELQIEERKKKEEKEEKINEEGILPSQPLEKSPQEVKQPITTIIKRIKFGIEDTRKKASQELFTYSPNELSQVLNDIITTFKSENDIIIRSNLLLSLSKVNKEEVENLLIEIIKNNNEPFSLRIVALDCSGNFKTENIKNAYKETLLNMVNQIETKIEETRRNIQQLNLKINNLTAQKITLENEIRNLENKISQIDNQIMQPEQFLTQQAIEKLLNEKGTYEEKIRKNNEEIEKINSEIQKINEEKSKYENFLIARTQKPEMKGSPIFQPLIKIDSTGQFIVPQLSEENTEKEQIIFVLKLMNLLSELKDTSSLFLIRRAWREFGTQELRIYYYIILGKLGEFRSIDLLANRLKENFGTENIEEEILIRKNIVVVLGEYLKSNPSQEIKDFIEYLAEESEYPIIRNSAKEILKSFEQKPSSVTASISEEQK